MEKKLKVIIGVLSALVLVLAGILIYQLTKKTELKEDVQVLTVDKQALTDQMTQLQQDYASLSSTNDTINTQLQVEREKVAQLIEKVRKTEATNQQQLKKYEQELGTLRSIMRSYIKQIDSLNQMNIALKEEATEAKKQIAETTTKYQELKEKSAEQEKQLDKGSSVKGRGITLIGLNSRGAESNRSTRVTQLKTNLSLVANDIAKTGYMTIYIRIKDPEGILMTNGGQQVFECAGEQLIYSASREVDYQGEELDISIYFSPGEDYEFVKGTYTVEAYSTKGKLGSALLSLR